MISVWIFVIFLVIFIVLSIVSTVYIIRDLDNQKRRIDEYLKELEKEKKKDD